MDNKIVHAADRDFHSDLHCYLSKAQTAIRDVPFKKMLECADKNALLGSYHPVLNKIISVNKVYTSQPVRPCAL